jgi:hypothetical protein
MWYVIQIEFREIVGISCFDCPINAEDFAKEIADENALEEERMSTRWGDPKDFSVHIFYK